MRRSRLVTLIVAVALILAAVAARAFFLEVWRSAPVVRISYFEPHAGGCAWYRQELGTMEREALAVFPTDCNRPRAVIAEDEKAALVWFAGEQGGESPLPLDVLVFEVDLGTGKSRRLPLPTPGETRELAYGDHRQPVAFTLDSEFELDAGADPGTASARAIAFAGKSYPLSEFPDGTDALAHALRLEDNQWRVDETIATRCCVDGAPGIKALRSHEARRRREKSARLAAEPRRLVEGDPKREKISHLPKFPFGARDALEISYAGDYELVAEGGTGARPWVLDARSGHVAYYGPLAASAAFWPVEGPERAFDDTPKTLP